jgi:hypothetical protein
MLSVHDALYAYPADFQTDGTLVANSGADTGLPRVALANDDTQRVKWVWAIPVGWQALALRWASITSATGNVVWQFAYRYFDLAEAGSVDGAVDDTIAIGAVSAGSVDAWKYNLPAAVAEIPVNLGLLGDSPFMLCSLSRLGSDASDTVGDDVAVGVVTATRVDP